PAPVSRSFCNTRLFRSWNSDELTIQYKRLELSELLPSRLNRSTFWLVGLRFGNTVSERLTGSVGGASIAQRREVPIQVMLAYALQLIQPYFHALSRSQHLAKLLRANCEIVGSRGRLRFEPRVHILHRLDGRAVGIVKSILQLLVFDGS